MPNLPQLRTCLSPFLISQFDFTESVVVVIDVFRATSTICAALDNEATAVIPVEQVADCFKIKEAHPEYLTAGERNGQIITGLEYGNSPLAFKPSVVKEKTLVLTTSNGTRLLHLVKRASKIITGSFLNLTAVCQYLRQQNKDILLACGGWQNKINLEDTLLAGAIIHRIENEVEVKGDSSIMAKALYQRSEKSESILDVLKSAEHYQRLGRFNLKKDIEYCCQQDIHPVVPVFNKSCLTIS